MLLSKGRNVLLPAVAQGFVNFLDKKKRMDNSKLDFYSNPNAHFHWKAMLATAGYADKTGNPNKERFLKDRAADTFLLGDSGGFQVIGGHLKVDWGNISCAANDKLRNEIIKWCEDECDLAMTLDIPTSAVHVQPKVFKNFRECLRHTKHNLEYWKYNTSKDMFLTVQGGANRLESDTWYDLNLPYDNYGYSFAALPRANIEYACEVINRLRADNKRINHLHFLGTTRLSWFLMLDVIADELGNSITQDAMSAFKVGTMGQIYSGYSIDNKKGPRLQICEFPKAGTGRIPFHSEVLKHYKIEDINFNGKIDTAGYHALMCHNVWYQTMMSENIRDLFKIRSAVIPDWLYRAEDEIRNTLQTGTNKISKDTSQALNFGQKSQTFLPENLFGE